VVTGIDVTVNPDGNATDGVADVKGADGAVVSGVVAGTNSTPVTNGSGLGGIAGSFGTLTLLADGTYHYVANANTSGTDIFTYTLKDGDGDTSTTTLTITVNNGQPHPVAGTNTVNEAALDLNKDGADLAAGTVTGSNPSSTAETVTGTLTLGDPDSPHVTNIAGATSSAVGGSAVTVNGTYGVLQIDQSGNYTYTLTTNDPHHSSQGTGIDGQTDAFTYTVTDAFGNTNTSTLTISIIDDVPTLGAFVNGTLPNEIGTVNGTFDINTGADGLGHFTITGPALAGITYTHTDNALGEHLIASAGATQVFTLDVNVDGTYVFHLLNPQTATVNHSTLQGLDSGHVNWTEVADGSIEFSSANAVNTSTQGLGVGNNFLNGGETFTMEFHTPGTGVGTDDPQSSNVQLVDAVNFSVNSANAGDQVSWIATDTVHNITTSGTAVVDASGTHLLIDPSNSFNILQITGVGNESIRLTAADVSQTILPSDQNLIFSITATDGDGDTTASQTLGIHVVAGDAAGNFTLTGGANADVIATSLHTDTVVGGNGFDIVDYRDDNSATGVTVNLSGVPGSGGTAAGDTYSSIEGILGGSGNDHLTGDGNANYLDGGAGNDTLTGNGGNDTFALKGDATNGHDTISDLNAGDLILVDVASLNLTINTSNVAAFTTATDATQPTAWNGSANQFVFNTSQNELYYSDNGTAAHAVDLAQIATGIPAAGAIHIF
jgi:VCBS repeat-containing protein